MRKKVRITFLFIEHLADPGQTYHSNVLLITNIESPHITLFSLTVLI